MRSLISESGIVQDGRALCFRGGAVELILTAEPVWVGAATESVPAEGAALARVLPLPVFKVGHANQVTASGLLGTSARGFRQVSTARG